MRFIDFIGLKIKYLEYLISITNHSKKKQKHTKLLKQLKGDFGRFLEGDSN